MISYTGCIYGFIIDSTLGDTIAYKARRNYFGESNIFKFPKYNSFANMAKDTRKRPI